MKHSGATNARGRLITFEGIDRSGKTTQSRLLLQWLKSIGYDALLVEKPSSTLVGELLNRIHKGDIPFQPISKFLLFAADYYILASAIIAPSLEAGKIVMIDRYVHSAFAYFPPVGLPVSWLKRTYEFMPPISLSYILDLPAQIALERQEKSGEKLDYYTSGYNDSEDTRKESFLEFQELVRQNYLDLAKADPRIHVLDATESVDEVHTQIKHVLANKFKLE